MEGLFPEVSRAAIASALGYTSVGFWLFAQTPQVIKNARLRSCEGLSLPFLSNWLLGDITNLLGCILTDQLPFQTYLAIYFCIVDLTLVGQYFYYRPKLASPLVYRSSSHLYTSSPHQSLLIQTAPPGYRASHNRTASSNTVPRHTGQAGPLSSSSTSTVRPGVKRSSQSYAHPPASGNAEASTSTHSSVYRGRDGPYISSGHDIEPRDGSYQAIYEAALDVARAAERAEHRRQQSQSRSRTRRVVSRKNLAGPSASTGMPGVEEDPLSPDLRNRSAMFDSFHSDMSAMTDASAASSSAAALTQHQKMSMSTPALLMGRGRSLQRTATGTVPPPSGSAGEEGEYISGLPGEGGRGVVHMRETRSKSKSRSASLARGSGRRAAGVAFMSLGFLATWSGTGWAGDGGPSTVSRGKGVVLQPPNDSCFVDHRQLSHPVIFNHISSPRQSQRNPNTTFILPTSCTSVKPNPDHEPPRDEPPDFQHLVGRISAWTCTTLYLTSRLPQIWKNFERKSIEGLSILLFLFAFCGNTAYVASIVLNPAVSADPSEANHYLLEALPYLLGSGGTLMFDLTIMIQALLYGSAPPVPQTTLERSSFRRPLFRRRVKHLAAEEGRSPTIIGPSGVNERQPLLSASMVMVASNSGTGSKRDQSVDKRSRSVSADVALPNSAGVALPNSGWRAGQVPPGSAIRSLRTVDEPGGNDGDGDGNVGEGDNDHR